MATDWNARLLDLYDSDPSLVAKDQLADALRAALAAQPQPDAYERITPAEAAAVSHQVGDCGALDPQGYSFPCVRPIDHDGSHQGYDRTGRPSHWPAVAGSATPTGDNE